MLYNSLVILEMLTAPSTDDPSGVFRIRADTDDKTLGERDSIRAPTELLQGSGTSALLRNSNSS